MLLLQAGNDLLVGREGASGCDEIQVTSYLQLFFIPKAFFFFWKKQGLFTLGTSGLFSRATDSFVGRHVFA